MNLINEKLINSKSFIYDVNVYGGDLYSKGKIEHDPPHFHINIDGKDIKILIPSVDEWTENKKIIFINGKYNQSIIKYIIDWLDEPNFKDNQLLNIEYIRLTWNKLNEYNNITTQMVKIYQHEASSIPSNKSIKDIKSIIIKNFEDFKIIVKGGDDYGKEVNVLTKPHFYIEINGGELKALIPTLKDWKTKEFIPSGEKYDIFIGLSNIHDQIIKYFHNIDNLKFIQNQWNELNKNNNFIEKFKI